MYVDSIYTATANSLPKHDSLKGHHSTDVVVVGAGITGISSALELAKKGYQVTVLEAQQVGWGASGRSGGQLIVGIADSVETMINNMGIDDARKAFDISVEAINLTKQRIKEFNINCDFTEGQMEVNGANLRL